jgi:two-component system alkaline phosphatase synthesis response regulator PhoP
MKILVVDDEKDLCEILQFNLENEDFDVDVAHSAEEALKLDVTKYNLILLDVMMGEMSGFKMASILKKEEKTQHIPIIFLTAREKENDMLTGFSIGADDYIAKPFSIKEVIARVKAVSSRAKKISINKTISYKTLIINVEKKEAKVAKEIIKLTKTEFELILLFLQHKNRILSRSDIMQKVWGDDVYVTDRTVDVNIARLRKKITPYGKLIVTKQSYGYGFME